MDNQQGQKAALLQILRRIFISVSMLWLGFLIIGIVTAVVTWIITGDGKDPILKGVPINQISQLRNILIGLGVIEILIGYWVKNRFLQSAQKVETIEKDKIFPLIAKLYAQAHLVPASMALSVSFYALILGLIGADRNSVTILLIISFFGLWLFQPRMKQLKALIAQIIGPGGQSYLDGS